MRLGLVAARGGAEVVGVLGGVLREVAGHLLRGDRRGWVVGAVPFAHDADVEQAAPDEDPGLVLVVDGGGGEADLHRFSPSSSSSAQTTANNSSATTPADNHDWRVTK